MKYYLAVIVLLLLVYVSLPQANYIERTVIELPDHSEQAVRSYSSQTTGHIGVNK